MNESADRSSTRSPRQGRGHRPSFAIFAVGTAPLTKQRVSRVSRFLNFSSVDQTRRPGRTALSNVFLLSTGHLASLACAAHSSLPCPVRGGRFRLSCPAPSEFSSQNNLQISAISGKESFGNHFEHVVLNPNGKSSCGSALVLGDRRGTLSDSSRGDVCPAFSIEKTPATDGRGLPKNRGTNGAHFKFSKSRAGGGPSPTGSRRRRLQPKRAGARFSHHSGPHYFRKKTFFTPNKSAW